MDVKGEVFLQHLKKNKLRNETKTVQESKIFQI